MIRARGITRYGTIVHLLKYYQTNVSVPSFYPFILNSIRYLSTTINGTEGDPLKKLRQKKSDIAGVLDPVYTEAIKQFKDDKLIKEKIGKVFFCLCINYYIYIYVHFMLYEI